jgi:hypothetical protein
MFAVVACGHLVPALRLRRLQRHDGYERCSPAAKWGAVALDGRLRLPRCARCSPKARGRAVVLALRLLLACGEMGAVALGARLRLRFARLWRRGAFQSPAAPWWL